MSLFENTENIRLLQNLLNPNEQSTDSESDNENSVKPSVRNFGPGNIGAATSSTQSIAKPSEENPSISETPSKPLEVKDDIEKWLEIQENEDIEALETRKIPFYEIIYKQAVTTEDVYLQMGNKTAASMSCEDIVIKISLPDENIRLDQMSLSVTSTEIDLQTPKYRLKLPLVHKINPNKGSAKYDSDQKVLKLTLQMIRELDFINF